MYRCTYMTTLLHAPRLEFGRPRANPTLESIEYVRAILKRSQTPVSRNDLLRTLSHWSHSMSRQRLNAVLKFLAADGTVAEASKGLIWVPGAWPILVEVAKKSRRL